MRKKIWITFFILMVSTILVTSIIFLSLGRAKCFNSLEDKIDSTALLLMELLESKDKWTDDELNRIIDIYSELVGGKITLTFSNGKVINQDTDNSKDENQKEPIFSKMVQFDGEHSIKELTISIFNKDLNGIDSEYRKYMLISLIISLIMVLIIGTRYVEYAVKPYRELTRATQNIINGVYDEELIFYDDKDLEYLAENFNFMSRKLQNTIKELQEVNTKLKATLKSIGDGVIAFDNKLNTILINPFAEQVLSLKEKEVMGRHLTQVIKDEDLKELFLTLVENTDSNKIEIEIKKPLNKIVNIYANPIVFHKYTQGRLGTVFIIQDVTKIKKLERVREDFVANVSHELKTPLTSLKGFIETLKDGAIEDRKITLKFLNIMDIEVNRLNALIDDLLLLSEVENKELKLISEPIYVEEVVDEVFEILGRSAEDKKITLMKEIVGEPPLIQGNYNYFKQMIINLVDNGIKYTHEGGYVKVWAKYEKGDLIIKVADNGMGIAEKQQDRIFERFYRVDKSRSRCVGGTGLGLAIVKHVISVFNGSILIESKPNIGTTFTLKIPIILIK